MNESSDQVDPQVPNLPSSPAPIPPEQTPETPPPVSWLKRLLTCNPFYLVSVALLLYGCYRVSMEPAIFNRETTHLLFNFSSLQIYEALLVGTAIFLSTRRIWYDSTLLVGLENMLLLIPFILISQAALIDFHEHSILKICLAGGILAGLRLGSLKLFVRELNFPKRALGIGLAFLAVNVALPVIYRLLHESKIGTKPDWGAAYYMNQWMWLALAPVLCSLVLLLPRPNREGTLWPQRFYLPLGFFTLWFVGTSVHLYCLGYVYDFNLSRELITPVIFTLAWVLHVQLKAYLPAFHRGCHPWTFVLPALIPVLAFTPEGSYILVALTAVNAAFYSSMAARRRGSPLTLNLALLSLAFLIADFPANWLSHSLPDFNRAKCIAAASAACLLFVAMRSRNPSLGVIGGTAAGISLAFGLGETPNTAHWAIEAGLIFLLVHSFRWEDARHPGARAVRIMASAVWTAHALYWANDGAAVWMPIMAAVLPLGICVAVRLLQRRWLSFSVFVASLVVIMAGPLSMTWGKLQTISIGMLSLLGSLLLFAIGTLLALTRNRWHKTEVL